MPPRTAPDVRALAAEALAEIALRGASSRGVLATAAPRLDDARDRALLHALVQAGARAWLRHDAALGHLMERPLRRREPVVHALLVLGLVQLEDLGMPPYAAVAATVEAVRALRKPRLAGLVNAVLRRWQRERASLLVLLARHPETRWAQPGWYIEALMHDWPEAAERVLEAANFEAPMTLRVNRRRMRREALAACLAESGHPARPHPFAEDALVLEQGTDVARLPGFSDGDFSVQDGAAQLAATLLDPHNGQRVLDACAAPGGKACHLLERHDLELLALDRDAARLARIRENLTRLGLAAGLLTADAAAPETWWDGQPFARILLDAPCSATGVMRRHPDVRLHRRASDLPVLVAQQRALLESLWSLLASGGRLLYITCSLLRAENEGVVTPFLATHPDATACPIRLPAGHAAGPGWQILPGEAGLDGMFYALLEKRAV